MKTYTLTLNYKDGRQYECPKKKQLKRVKDSIEIFKKNDLVHSMTLLTEEFGEYEHAGEYKFRNEIVYTADYTAKAYHGTSKDAWKFIQKEGLRSSIGYVYCTPDLTVAKKFGEIVLEIDLSKLEQDKIGSYREMLCDVLGTDDFIHYAGDIPPAYITRI